jgi:pimeloyl-ACP methyl ester carboxylesterase
MLILAPFSPNTELSPVSNVSPIMETHSAISNPSARNARWILVLILAMQSLYSPGQAAKDEKVDLGGYRVHVLESGVGSPTVIFESGLGEASSTWSDVQPKVALFARTLAYDRPGLGDSDPSPHPRSVREMAVELHSLLQSVHIPPPYILVGHSLGGTIVQIFAHAYPNEIAGLVLVDPEDSRLDHLLRSHMTAEEWAIRQKALDEAMPKMPAAVQAEITAYKKSASEAEKALPLPNVPVVLLTGTEKNPDFPGNPLEQDLKLQLHDELLAQIPHSRHILVPNSRHYIQNDAPALVIEAIRSVVDQCRSGVGPARVP